LESVDERLAGHGDRRYTLACVDVITPPRVQRPHFGRTFVPIGKLG
jgi:hypothetical protein